MAKEREERRNRPDSTRSSKSSKSNKNREFAVITYLFVGIFICMMGYFVYFQIFKSEDFINSPYNTRQDSFSSRIIRGEILSADGKILAQTNTNEEGTDTRYYPYANMYAHVVGYDTNGKTGIESAMNFNLLRSHSFILERMLNEIKGEKSVGDDVITTLNSTLQETAYNALGSYGYDGAVVVLEPSTGKILAMVSKPDYDPNIIATNYSDIISADDTDSVLVNRATQGLYPPGSTFKILTTLEYIRENPDYSSYAYTCTGGETVGDTTIHCYGSEVHGAEDLMSSFSNSCNASYAHIGQSLDITKFSELCNSFLFNKSLPITLESNKSSFTLSKDDSAGMVMQTAIGQGETLVSPMHMAMIAGTIANDGVLMKPYVVDHTVSETDVTVEEYTPQTYGTLMTQEEAATMQGFMEGVVTNGTGRKLQGASYTAAGKTGSAEFSNTKGESHSWFVGYASQDGYEDIAIAVVVEGAGTGSEYAVPIAKQVFDAYFQ